MGKVTMGGVNGRYNYVGPLADSILSDMDQTIFQQHGLEDNERGDDPWRSTRGEFNIAIFSGQRAGGYHTVLSYNLGLVQPYEAGGNNEHRGYLILNRKPSKNLEQALRDAAEMLNDLKHGAGTVIKMHDRESRELYETGKAHHEREEARRKGAAA